MMMDTTHNNAISALVDGELGYAEGSRAVDQLLDDDQSHGSLQRYQLIGACMRGEAMQINSASLFDRIHQQLEQEPTVIAPAAAAAMDAKEPPKKHNVATFALAASVVALMVLAVVRLQAPLSGVQVASQPLDTPIAASPQKQLVADNPAAEADTTSEAEIDRYLMGHQIYSSGTINPDFAATLVSYESF